MALVQQALAAMRLPQYAQAFEAQVRCLRQPSFRMTALEMTTCSAPSQGYDDLDFLLLIAGERGQHWLDLVSVCELVRSALHSLSITDFPCLPGMSASHISCSRPSTHGTPATPFKARPCRAEARARAQARQPAAGRSGAS